MHLPIKHIKETMLKSIKVAAVALVITLGVTYAYAAWVGPTAAPPGNNTDAPINIGTTDQIKNGRLGLGSLAVFGNSAFSGYMKIGDSTTTCTTPLAGALRFYTTIDNKCLQLCVNSNWQDVSCGGLNLTISSNTFNYNIYQEAGSPTNPVNVTLTIESGVIVGSVNTAQPALTTGSFPSGSTVKMINNGRIQGRGGDGGDGGWDHNLTDGRIGGNALEILFDIEIDNSTGEIWSGGGGGGGGAVSFIHIGGGGGGGAGYLGGIGGEIAWDACDEPVQDSEDGTSESGGLPYTAPSCTANGGLAIWTWLTGGKGGDPGLGGLSGQSSGISGGFGGSAGNSIVTNGHTITWIGTQGDIR